MEDLHAVFSQFKERFPEIQRKEAELGAAIHERGGPLPEKVRWLLKVAISAATRHGRALETHLAKAREAGASEDEILHVLLLLIPTCGFPTFMEAYDVASQRG
ncbi:MAG: carboxymuconolactone decarboxylase family protein [Deltaproteobacteria bacterium]|nr:carboxymuconolactone decarboxylase family protein [Deltaproteobacteria bacterium]